MENKEVFRKSNLERISSPEKMNDYIKVINPSVVIMLAALGLLLLGGLAWGLMGNIPLTENLSGAFYASEEQGRCDKMAAVVSVETAAELKTGMEVQVSPSTADRETYGYMKGRIERIGEFPVSEEEVISLVKNKELAGYLMPDSVGILVIISFDADKATASGIAWSSSKGKDVTVKKGSTGTALAVVKNQKPIELILE